MREQESSMKLISAMARIMPYVFLMVVVSTFSGLIVFGRSDLALKSLYILIPVALASLIVIIKPGLFRKDTINLSGIHLSQQSFLNLVLLFALLFIISLILIIGNKITPLSYYVLMGVMASLVFVQILSFGEENTGRRNIIILEIVFISTNLALGQTLRLPAYFGYGDILGHTYNIESIVTTGHVDSAMLVDYQYFPGFHIFGAMGNLLSNLDIQYSYFIFNSLFFMVSIPLVYLLVRKLTRNVHIPLLATLMYSLSLEVIFYSMYMITRAMAFVMCFLLLYLLIRGRENLKLRVGALLMVFPLILIHHTTLVHFTIILLILVVLELVLSYSKPYIGWNFLLFFTVAYLGYWVWFSYPFFESTVTDYFSAPDITQVAMPEAEKPLYLIFTTNAGNMIMAFLAILGIVGFLRARRELATLGIVITLFSIFALVVYTPAISGFLSKALLTARLELLVAPFLAFVAAAGLLFIIGNIQKWWRSPVIKIFTGISIIFLLAFSSMIIRANYNGLHLPDLLGRVNDQYFTESEITTFSFTDRYSGDFLYSGDYASSIYMRSRLGLPVDQSANIFDPSSINDGYFLFRESEFQSCGQLSFVIWGKDETGNEEYVYQQGDSPDLVSSWEKQNKIYDNGSVYIYKTKTSG